MIVLKRMMKKTDVIKRRKKDQTPKVSWWKMKRQKRKNPT